MIYCSIGGDTIAVHRPGYIQWSGDCECEGFIRVGDSIWRFGLGKSHTRLIRLGPGVNERVLGRRAVPKRFPGGFRGVFQRDPGIPQKWLTSINVPFVNEYDHWCRESDQLQQHPMCENNLGQIQSPQNVILWIWPPHVNTTFFMWNVVLQSELTTSKWPFVNESDQWASKSDQWMQFLHMKAKMLYREANL